MGRRKIDPARDAARSRALLATLGGEVLGDVVTIGGPPSFQEITVNPDCPAVTWVDHTQQRALVTFRADHSLWNDTWDAAHLVTPGDLVRLEPPAAAAPADVDRVKATLLKMGAAAVRVMPRVAEQAAQAPAHDPAAPPVGGSLRERAQARVAALVGVRDRAALKDAVDEALTSAGI